MQGGGGAKQGSVVRGVSGGGEGAEPCISNVRAIGSPGLMGVRVGGSVCACFGEGGRSGG